MVRLPKHRPPTPPGRMLARALEERGLTQSELAKRIDVPFQRINLIVNGKRAVTADSALRLARLFGTTPGLWLNAQRDWDLWHQARESQSVLDRIQPVAGATPQERASPYSRTASRSSGLTLHAPRHAARKR